MGCPSCGGTKIFIRIDETRRASCPACGCVWTQTGSKQEDVEHPTDQTAAA